MIEVVFRLCRRREVVMMGDNLQEQDQGNLSDLRTNFASQNDSHARSSFDVERFAGR